TTTFAPFPVHPMAPLELDRQIPKRGDQRQMEAWQRIGTYAAGQALDAAGIKGDAALLGRMDMIVAAGGGERDYTVDEALLSGLPKAADPGAYLNEHLQGDLRPTLFLAQLSNLLAGNISIVHGVTGSSRTLMGEEASGADGLRIACARIAASQGDLFLVGGSYNAQRPDILVHYEMGGTLWKRPFAGVWERQAHGGGMVLGSVGCFLVIESRSHAAARGVQPVAHIAAIKTDRCARAPGEATANATRQLAAASARLDPATTAVISGASGVAAATREEQAFIAGLGLPARAAATALGQSMEPSFPASVALAALAVRHGRLFGPLEAAEAPMATGLRQAMVTSWGHWRGEALALIEPA
ncbi:MAG TPA: beta-ketoacyl-ACP synthase, partial [Acetobacteraceae bacterium]|nr:beta-ketoacyl-ACP synthase [Acetobacteraceae bacterium]